MVTVTVEGVYYNVTVSLIYRCIKKPKNFLTPFYKKPIPLLLLQYIYNINTDTTLNEVFNGWARFESQK